MSLCLIHCNKNHKDFNPNIIFALSYDRAWYSRKTDLIKFPQSDSGKYFSFNWFLPGTCVSYTVYIDKYSFLIIVPTLTLTEKLCNKVFFLQHSKAAGPEIILTTRILNEWVDLGYFDILISWEWEYIDNDGEPYIKLKTECKIAFWSKNIFVTVIVGVECV